jgi:hypothetical protein
VHCSSHAQSCVHICFSTIFCTRPNSYLSFLLIHFSILTWHTHKSRNVLLVSCLPESEGGGAHAEVAHVWVVGEVSTVSPSSSSMKQDSEDWEDFFGLAVLKSGPPFTHIATLSSSATESTVGSSISDNARHVGFNWVCSGMSHKVATSVNELRGSWLSSIHDKNIALWLVQYSVIIYLLPCLLIYL